jgi:hypothetical protein
MVERAIGLDLGDLDLRAISMICELALDPPLPFMPEGAAADWSWDTLHPGARFRHLLDAAGQVGIFGGDGTAFDNQRMQLEVDLLARARLRRADHDAVRHWLGTYDEDTTEWPSQELGWQHAQMALLGRTEVTERPGVLQDLSRDAGPPPPHSFYDLPFVLMDGSTEFSDPDAESEARLSGQQILNAHVARMTDHFAFRTGPLMPLGLPTDPDDPFAVFAQKAHEFFASAWGIDVPRIRLP